MCQWVGVQRKKRSKLTPDRLRRLSELDFDWDPVFNKWQSGFQALIAFKKREGHCRVPGKHIENGYKLGQWVSIKRYERNDLSDERRKLLEEIGFLWIAK